MLVFYIHFTLITKTGQEALFLIYLTIKEMAVAMAISKITTDIAL